ncbi:hypothetical protein F5Y05DRAFT_75432 [Hypoxylon sp. FL0543]|nr:hypothetical protein F5Y05DRAFT_75432 [Hypoxylon sp. FL0543]
MSVDFITVVITAGQEQPSIERRQVTLTQTITYPDATSTAVVTLDRGGPPTESPAPGWSSGAASSDGLGQQQIGIIVGCILGVVVLAIVIWCCCTRRCGCAPYTVYEEDRSNLDYYDNLTVEVSRPQRTLWPVFPRSITPPPVPDYVANDRNGAPGWTAYEASRRPRQSYYRG